LISFVYRAWEKYRYHVQFEADRTDAYTRRLLCLVGLGSAGMTKALGAPCLPYLRIAGLLSDVTRSAAGVECLLRDQFENMSIRVESLLERVVRIPGDQTVQLGKRSCRLGQDACIGEWVRDRSGAFRITIGPLGSREYSRLLPGKPDFTRMVRMVRYYVSDPLEFDLHLLLEANEVPALRLTGAEEHPLGQMSWICPTGSVQGEAVFSTRNDDPLLREHS
jgi:type VI secretion system protein ImpH